MIEICRNKCYATNGKLKRMSLLHNNELQNSYWKRLYIEELILIGSFLVI